jgi:hypothetical protein
MLPAQRFPAEPPMRIALAAFIALLIAGPARADEARDVLEAIAKCADIADSADRLKCYDAAAPRAKSALATPPQPAKEPAKEPKVTVETYGLPQAQRPVEKVEDFGKPAPPPQPDEIKEITSNVLEFAKTPRGRAIFILENGQVWRQLDSDTSEIRDPQPGKTMRVKIENGFLGSYNLTIEGRNGLIKVTRLK